MAVLCMGLVCWPEAHVRCLGVAVGLWCSSCDKRLFRVVLLLV
nr:MAG TPA: hypothetical protein [Caudoviricetes sp.]